MQIILIWLLKTVFGKRVVMAVFSDGTQQIKTVRYTLAGKCYVSSKGDKVGFLDQPTNQSGEFRKGISDEKLARWFDV